MVDMVDMVALLRREGGEPNIHPLSVTSRSVRA